MGIVVYEGCIGHVDLEGHRCHVLAPGLSPVGGELPGLATVQYDRGICI